MSTTSVIADDPLKSKTVLDELSSLSVNGAQQWLLYRSENFEAPVVLFVHGGPGSPLMYFSRAFDDIYLQNFTVVHWDQRGSGKSYDPKAPVTSYNFSQIVDDGLVVAEHLKSRFNNQKILLVGHSWGTMVASHMVAARPEIFSSYVSVGTVADMARGEKHKYDLLQAKMAELGDQDALKQLKAFMPPFHNFEA